jgi:hypothetical protein
MEPIPAPRYISSLPIRLQNNFVTYFPRKFFRFLRHDVQDKYYSHPLLLSKRLRAGPAPPLPAGYRFGQADSSLLQQIISHPEALPPHVYHNRLDKGDSCYFLSVNDEVVTLQWLSTSHCGILRGFDRGVDFFKLAPYQAYTYDFYTYLNRRKLGYGTLLKQQIVANLAARHFSELLSCVMHDNIESLKIHMKMNYSLIGLPCNFRLMDWHWTTWASPGQLEETREWLEAVNRTLIDRNRQS